MLFDTHAHMDDRAFDEDRQELLSDLLNQQIGLLMNPGCSLESSRNAVKLAKATHYKFKIVTLAGELLQPGGSITGGSVNRAQALLGRKDEIERLNLECDKLQEQTEKLEDEIDDLMELAEKSRRKEAQLREKLSESENKLMKVKAEADMKTSLLEMAKRVHPQGD